MTVKDSTDFKFYTRTHETWDAMYADCAAAKQAIELDLYILNNDDIGRKFLTLFIKKARAGVHVHLLLDHIGSLNLYSSPLIAELVSAGGSVHFYNRLSSHKWLWPAKWFPRNHVKALLIDSEIAYVGSACIRADMANWRDTTIRMTGAPVLSVERQFAWSRLVWWRRRGIKRAFRHEADASAYTYFVHRPSTGMNPIYREIHRAIASAQKNVRIVTPYFLAPYALRRVLKKAVKRGVKVEIMMNERSDARIADLVSQSYFRGLIKRGITIMLYTEFMLHAKCVMVDDTWCSLGSSNIDYLSLHVNREANMIIKDKGPIHTLIGHFEEDLKLCKQADLHYWKRRSWWEKALGYLGRSIKGVL